MIINSLLYPPGGGGVSKFGVNSLLFFFLKPSLYLLGHLDNFFTNLNQAWIHISSQYADCCCPLIVWSPFAFSLQAVANRLKLGVQLLLSLQLLLSCNGLKLKCEWALCMVIRRSVAVDTFIFSCMQIWLFVKKLGLKSIRNNKLMCSVQDFECVTSADRLEATHTVGYGILCLVEVNQAIFAWSF